MGGGGIFVFSHSKWHATPLLTNGLIEPDVVVVMRVGLDARYTLHEHDSLRGLPHQRSADVTARCGQFALLKLSDDDSHLADGLGDIRLRGMATSYLSAVSA